MNTGDYLLANAAPDDVAVIDPAGVSHTYADVRDAAERIVSLLQASGEPAGSRIGIVAANSAFWVAAYLAVLRAGFVAVPLPAGSQAAQRLGSVGCAVVLTDSAIDRLLAITPDDVARHAQRSWPDEPTDLDADAALMFTSGTTAQPKAVRITHRNLQANTDSILDYLQLTAQDRMLVVLPFFYCFGASLLHTHLRVGGSVVLCNSMAFPETAVQMLEERQCTGLAGVPSTFQALLRRTSLARRELPSLRLVQQAGGALPASTLQNLRNAVAPAAVYVMYGQTEATARLSYLPPESQDTKAGSVGKGIPGVRLEVRDEQGRPVRPGETGEIWAVGDNISPGYLDDPVATAQKFRDGALRTGDLAHVDDDGYIYITARKDQFIKTWGHRVSAAEVEAAAVTAPGVVAAAAVGEPDDVAGEALILYVELAGAPISPMMIRAHIADRLPKHMVPRAVHIVSRLPLTDNGKLDRTRLRSGEVLAAAPREDR